MRDQAFIIVIDPDGSVADRLGDVGPDNSLDITLVGGEEEAAAQFGRASAVACSLADGADWRDMRRRLAEVNPAASFVVIDRVHQLEVALQCVADGVSGYVSLSESSPEQVFGALERAARRGHKQRDTDALLRSLCTMVDEFLDHMVKLEGEILELRRRLDSKMGGGAVFAPSVLIVDAEAEQAAQLETFLERSGCRIKRATSAKAALDLAKSQGFNIAIVDRSVGEEDGIEVIKQLRRILPESDQVIVVGFTSADDAVEALRHGAATFLLKPYDNDAVTESLQEVIMRQAVKARSRQYLDDFRGRYESLLDRRRALQATQTP